MSENTDTKKKPLVPKQTLYITFFALAMMNVANVGTGNNIQLAFFGLSGITFYAVAALMFFLPTGLVAAELASGWPERGGIFRWVGEGLGGGWGFLCLFILWFDFIFNFGSSMSANAATIMFYLPNYERAVKFAQHPKYVVLIMTGWLLYYWLITYLGTRGVKFLSVLIKYGMLIGTIIPFVLQLILLVVWLFQGNQIAVDLAPSNLIPKWDGFGTLSMAAIVLFSFAGIDENASYIKKLRNPRKEFPKAMFLSMIFCFVLMCIGLMIIEFVVPVKNLNLMFTGFTVMKTLGETIGMPYLYMVFLYLGFFTSLASGLVQMSAPAYMLAQSGAAGYIPKSLQKMNDKGMPARLMYLGMALITAVSYLVVFLPGVEGFMELGTQAITIIYLGYYILMFITFLRLRYTQPNRPRTFKIPGGMWLPWLIAIAGMISCVFGIFIAFYPPTQLKAEVGSGFAYVLILACLVAVVPLLAFIIYKISRKKDWVDPKNKFAPFTWQIEGFKKPTKALSNVPTEIMSLDQDGMGMPIKKHFDPNEKMVLPSEYQSNSKHHKDDDSSGGAGGPAASTTSATATVPPKPTAPTSPPPVTPTAAPEKESVNQVVDEQKQVDADVQKVAKEEQQLDQDVQKLDSQSEAPKDSTPDK